MTHQRHTKRSAETLSWYAFRVEPQTERRVARHLRWQDMTAVVPVFRSWRLKNRYAKAKVQRERPIMPGYVWVGFDGNVPWWRLLGREDVFSVVSFSGLPAMLDASQVARMLSDERRGLYADSDDWRNMRSGREYKLGDLVEIETGPFTGFKGKVVDLTDTETELFFKQALLGKNTMRVPVDVCSKVA